MLPVWILLQPRDFINAEQLVLALIVLYGGLFLAHRPIVAPAVRLAPEGAPLLFPFLFITIACGAISGFHSLVSSGTSSKQLRSEGDAQMVGYGSMVAEGILAVAAILACVAGFASRAAWDAHYASWGAAGGLGAKLDAFVNGGQVFVGQFGISEAVAQAFLGVVIVSFAMTTIDTATRLQRYIIGELGATLSPLRFLQNRYLGGVLAAGSALALALAEGGGKGGLTLWPVFGASNQLLAALALTVITLWLMRRRKPVVYTALPMVFMLVVTVTALALQVKGFVAREGGPNWLLAGTSCAIIVLAVWLLVEAALAWRRIRASTQGELLAEGAASGPGQQMPRGPAC